MSLTPLPIGAAPYYNIDPASKGITATDTCVDGWIDEVGTVHRRGGLLTWQDVATNQAGQGIFYWQQLDCLIVRSGTKAFKVTKDGTVTEITGVVFNQSKTIFADGNKIDGSPWLYMFDGGHPVYTLDGDTATRLDDTKGCPNAVKFGAWVAGRFLVAQSGTRNFFATDTNPESGTIENDYFLAPENPLTAEANPDNLDYLGARESEIVVAGYQGVEYWQADGSFFSSVIGAESPCGVVAPYSVVEANNSLYFLGIVDNGRKLAIVRMQGRAPQVVSLPIEKILKSMTTVNDAIGWITDDSEYVITFPTEGQTWCHDYLNDNWYQWSAWDMKTPKRDEFKGRFACAAWGKLFMQSRTDGKIFEYSRNVYQDGGEMFVTEYRTGWIAGSGAVICPHIRLHLKRGIGGESGDEPALIIRWRDNGKQEWKSERQVSLGKQGEYEFYRDIRQCGSYKSRQYSFLISGNFELCLVKFEHDVSGLLR